MVEASSMAIHSATDRTGQKCLGIKLQVLVSGASAVWLTPCTPAAGAGAVVYG